MIPDRVVRRFWSKVAVTSIDQCWIWQMSTGNHGYGQIGWATRDDGRRMVLAHRVAYWLIRGPIPAGLTVDHLCRVRTCCNPWHLQLLSNVENARRNGNWAKTHCLRGHPFSEGNTRLNDRGHRFCRTCAAMRREAA